MLTEARRCRSANVAVSDVGLTAIAPGLGGFAGSESRHRRGCALSWKGAGKWRNRCRRLMLVATIRRPAAWRWRRAMGVRFSRRAGRAVSRRRRLARLPRFRRGEVGQPPRRLGCRFPGCGDCPLLRGSRLANRGGLRRRGCAPFLEGGLPAPLDLWGYRRQRPRKLKKSQSPPEAGRPLLPAAC